MNGPASQIRETARSVARWAIGHGYAPASDIDVAYHIRRHVEAARHHAQAMIFDDPAATCSPSIADALILLAVLAERRRLALDFSAPATREIPADAPAASAMLFGGNVFDLLANAVARDVTTQPLRIAEAAAVLKALAVHLGLPPQDLVDRRMATLRAATGTPLEAMPDRGAMALAVVAAAGQLLDEVQRQATALAERRRLPAHALRGQPVSFRINAGVVLDTASALKKLQEAST